MKQTRRKGFAVVGATLVLALSQAATGAPAKKTFIVESVPAGQNNNKYSEGPGILAASGAHSTAAFCTPGNIGQRYGSTYRSIVGEKHGVFKADLLATATYEVWATWGTAQNRRAGIQHRVTHAGGSTDVLVDQAATSNAWVSLGQFTFNRGVNAGTVDVSNLANDASGSFYCDAILWEVVGGSCYDTPQVGLQTPIVANQQSITVTGVDATATSVIVYADGVEAGRNDTPGGAASVVVNVSGGVSSGASITATQVVAGTEGCQPLTGVIVDACGQVPAVTITNILAPGGTTVTVTGIDPSASAVTVYGSLPAPWSKSASPGGAATFNVTLDSGLVNADVIYATQTVSTVEGCKPGPSKVVGDCAQIPNVSIAGLVGAGQTTVLINGVHASASLVTVYDGANPIGSVAPGGASLVSVSVPPLVQGNVLRATQTVLGVEGCMPTTGRTVTAAGMIEDFEGTVSIARSPDPGSYRTWYDAHDTNYTDVLGPTNARAKLFGSNCLNVTDHGGRNGAYAIFEKVIPQTGVYHIAVDMLIDEPVGYDYDFYQTYQVGVIVNGTHRAKTADVFPAINNYFGKYPCLTPLQDGTTETQAIQVYVKEFTANAGDDLLIAFSTDVSTFTAPKWIADPASYPGMKIDNIRLVPGPKPTLCTDVDPVDVLPTLVAPLEQGGVKVRVTGIGLNASGVKVYADGAQIGSATFTPGSAPSEVDVNVTPLQAGQTILASQTVSGIESCQCPGATGPVVGLGANTQLKIALGIRETGGAGPVGVDGGVTGKIEWIGASAYTNSAPQGKPLPTDVGWQTITFDPATDDLTAFPMDGSNGIIDGTWGTLEHIALTTEGTNTGRYVVLIDEIYNGDTLLANFDSHTDGSLVMFRLPGQSGTTDMHLMPFPNVAQVDSSDGADNTDKCYKVSWQFLDNSPKRWLRLTTVDDGDTTDMPLQNPMIDLTKPITMKIKLYGPPACNAIFADSNGDGDVDMDDFAEFQKCINIGGGAYPVECGCFDQNFNGIIDVNDLNAFHDCASGAAVPAIPGCGN